MELDAYVQTSLFIIKCTVDVNINRVEPMNNKLFKKAIEPFILKGD
jgi:hypothetical protein